MCWHLAPTSLVIAFYIFQPEQSIRRVPVKNSVTTIKLPIIKAGSTRHVIHINGVSDLNISEYM